MRKKRKHSESKDYNTCSKSQQLFKKFIPQNNYPPLPAPPPKKKLRLSSILIQIHQCVKGTRVEMLPFTLLKHINCKHDLQMFSDTTTFKGTGIGPIPAPDLIPAIAITAETWKVKGSGRLYSAPAHWFVSNTDSFAEAFDACSLCCEGRGGYGSDTRTQTNV